jgi:hypothetical protein
MAGLRTAQTEEALLNAQRAQEEQDANSQLEDAYVRMGMKPSDAHAAALISIGNHGNAQVALQALQEQRKLANTDIVSDPTKFNTPAQTAAFQGISGKPLDYQTVPGNYAVAPGITPPTVLQTPQAAATTGEQSALAHLHNVQAAAGGFAPKGQDPFASDPALATDVAEFIRQNPNLAGNLRSLVSNGGPEVVRAFLHGGTQPGAAPGAAPGGAPGAPAPVPGQPSAATPPNGIVPAPGVSLKEQADIRHDFASGIGAKQTTSLNTMVQHSILFDRIADELNNGNFTPTNAITNMWKRVMGSPVPSNLKIAGSFLGREAVRATVNSGAGTGEERELAVSDSSSPEALHQAAQTLRSLAAGQLHSLTLRAKRGGVDIGQLLGPEAKAAYGLEGGDSPGGGGGALPPQAASQLKEGFVTTFGNGQKWTLQGGKPTQVQ